MWPWEHLALGYLLYSGYTHSRLGRPPDGRTTLVLAVATQLPDLIDKPLAWTVALLPSGHSLAHSLAFALLFVGIALLLARRRGVPHYGTAVAVGYLSHLPADVLYPLAVGNGANFGFLFWPLMPAPNYETAGLFLRTSELFAEFVGYLGTPRGFVYLLAEGAFLLLVLLLWLYDGIPGIAARRAR